MVRKAWDWIGRGLQLHQAILLLLLLIPAAVGFLGGLFNYFSRSPAQAIPVGVLSWGVAQIFLAAIAALARWQSAKVPNLKVQTTGGPGEQVRLVVTNHGRQGEFRATAELIAKRNDPNKMKSGSFTVPWLGGTPSITLATLQQDALLLARFEVSTQLIPDRFMMGDICLIELRGSSVEVWSGIRWVMTPDAAVPELDLEIRLTGGGASRPLVLKYTLRPSEWLGPLELVPR
jgi:hypothetical protein